MLYSLVRPIATLGIHVFYRKIYISNADRIPRNKPVILAANHPTGFMEPCILACHLDRPLYYLVRGDFFKKPLYRRLLQSLHMIPIYRIKDGGYSVLKNNFETFDYCFSALRENKTLMILAEGSAEHEKRLRPLKKGTGRVAFGTLERYPELEDIYVVPVGVNYTYAEYPRTEVMIDFGEPLRVRDYWNAYQQNPNQAMSDFTEALRQQMAERIIIIDKKEDEELTEYLLQIDRSQRPESVFPIVSHQQLPLTSEKKIADRVSEMSAEAKSNILVNARNYFQELEKTGINDAALVNKRTSPIVATLLLILGFPFFIIGFLFNFLPYYIAESIKKKRVRRPEFYAPVLWAVSMGTYLIYWILWLVGLLIFATPAFLLWLLIMPTLGYFAILYRAFWRRKQAERKITRLNKQDKKALLDKRAYLQNAIGRIVVND